MAVSSSSSPCFRGSRLVFAFVSLTPTCRATFHAGGKVTAQLQCTDETWTNPNWTMGQIYTDRHVDCAPVTLPMSATWIWGVSK